MKHFWALPAFLRIALASPHSFSVFEDLLAFPQYEVVFPDTYITENEATSLLSQPISRSTSSATPVSQATQDLSKPGKQQPGVPATPDDELELAYERVVFGGRRYLCTIPIIPEAGPQNSSVSAEEAKAEEEKELVRASDRGGELLDGMLGDCIYYASGWWSYAFCYKNYVKQYHQLQPGRNGLPIWPPQEDPSVNSFILGRFEGEGKQKESKKQRKTLGTEEEQTTGSGEKKGTDKTELRGREEKGLSLPRLEVKGSSRYMVQRLTGGTECDLTGRERKIEVQFYCNAQPVDKIAMIKEVSTCSYLMIIHTPRLCSDVAFQPSQVNRAHPVSCRAVLSDAEIDDRDLAHLEEKVRKTENLLTQHENNNPLRAMEPSAEGSSKRGPVIGGIAVGARRLVGTEDKVIEPGIIAGGGKEKFLGTLVTSDGKQMTLAELKKVNMDPKDVEKLKRSSKEIAGDKEWRLDLVETPQGRREYRLIEYIDEDDGTDGKDGKESEGKDKDKINKSKDKKGAGGEESEEGSEEVYKDEL